jgi:hypothetical protein
VADPNSIAAIPPGVDPTEWLKVQRQMSLAQALQSMAMSPVQNDLQQPAGGGRFYQAARVGPVAALSKLAEAMMANRGFKQAMPAMAEQMTQGMQAFQPGGQMVPTGQSALVEGAQGAPEGPVPAPRTPTYTQAPPNPLNPQGLPPAVMMRLYQSDPAKYATMLQGTTEYQNALRAAGGDPQKAMDLMHAQAVKSGTVEARPGAWVQGPNGKWVQLPQGGPGQHLSFDAQGNLVASRIPGYIETAADLAGKEEASKQANIPRLIPLGGGKEAYGYPQDILKAAAPANRAPPSNSPTAPQYLPKAPQIPALPQAPPSARAPQGQAENGLWSSVPKLNIPNTPGQTTDTFHQKILADAAAKHEELVNKYGSEADLADARIAFNKEALSVLKGAETGPLSDELTKLRAKAQEMGVPASWIPGADTVGNTQLLKKFALRNPLLNLKPTFGGRPAASEFNVLKEEASPSPTMLKSVFARLVNLDNQQAEYTKQRAEDYGTYVSKGGDPMRFESFYANRRPLANYFAQKNTPPEALARLKQHPETLNDFKSAFGWDPTR